MRLGHSVTRSYHTATKLVPNFLRSVELRPPTISSSEFVCREARSFRLGAERAGQGHLFFIIHQGCPLLFPSIQKVGNHNCNRSKVVPWHAFYVNWNAFVFISKEKRPKLADQHSSFLKKLLPKGWAVLMDNPDTRSYSNKYVKYWSPNNLL